MFHQIGLLFMMAERSPLQALLGLNKSRLYAQQYSISYGRLSSWARVLLGCRFEIQLYTAQGVGRWQQIMTVW